MNTMANAKTKSHIENQPYLRQAAETILAEGRGTMVLTIEEPVKASTTTKKTCTTLTPGQGQGQG